MLLKGDTPRELRLITYNGRLILRYAPTRLQAQANNVMFSGSRDSNLDCAPVQPSTLLFLFSVERPRLRFQPQAPMIHTLFDLPVFTTLILQILLSTVVVAVPRCWAPEVSPKPLIFRECNEIIVHQIGQTYDPSRRRPFDPSLPLIFSRDRVPRPDVRTPKTWYNYEIEDSSCLIGVDIPSHQGGSDKTSLQDIKMAAMEIAVECVIKSPHLGGILQIGWANKINVVITSMMAAKTDFNGTIEEA